MEQQQKQAPEQEQQGISHEKTTSALTKALTRSIRPMQTPKGNAERDDFRKSERTLATKRSELTSEIAAQEASAKPQQQDKNEAVKKQTDSKAKKEPETEPVKFYHAKNGHLLFTLQLPKGGKYTTADVNRAAKAAGFDYTYSPSWTPQGWGIRGRDILQAVKKAWQRANQTPEPKAV